MSKSLLPHNDSLSRQKSLTFWLAFVVFGSYFKLAAETEKLFNPKRSRKLAGNIQQSARRKLEILDAAEVLEDLRIPPGNRLEKLSGNRSGQHSIRINNQWRICFEWRDVYG